MSKEVDIGALEKEHQRLFPKCKALCVEIERQLSLLIEKENIQLAVPLQFRPKTFSSISEKLQQGRFTIKKSLLELQDLAGIRIITLFKRDSLKVAELISSHFEIIKQYNTEEKLDDAEFGYSSIHIICQVKKTWLDTPSFSEFKNLNLEIQIRTLSQHSWAEASNIFQYKKEESVPKPLKRSISRISALLEIVDLEFERLLSERENYKIEAKEQLASNNENATLNVDLLQEILKIKLPVQHKLPGENYSNLLDNLITLGYTNVASLNELIKKHYKYAIEENKRVCDGFSNLYQFDKNISDFENYTIDKSSISQVLKGVFFSQGGLIRKMLSKDIGKEWWKAYDDKKRKEETSKGISL